MVRQNINGKQSEFGVSRKTYQDGYEIGKPEFIGSGCIGESKVFKHCTNLPCHRGSMDLDVSELIRPSYLQILESRQAR